MKMSKDSKETRDRLTDGELALVENTTALILDAMMWLERATRVCQEPETLSQLYGLSQVLVKLKHHIRDWKAVRFGHKAPPDSMNRKRAIETLATAMNNLEATFKEIASVRTLLEVEQEDANDIKGTIDVENTESIKPTDCN